MALVLMATHPWGTLWDSSGNVQPGEQVSFTNIDDATAVTHYADADAASPSTGPITADANGRLMRWVAEDSYDMELPDATVLQVEATSGRTSAKKATLPVNFGDDTYNPDQTGVTSCATAFAAWVDDVRDNGAGFVPAGSYYLPTGYTVDSLPENATITFAGGAEFFSDSGITLTFTNCPRLTLWGPRVGTYTGCTATAGIKVGVGCVRLSMHDPVIWCYGNVPSNYDGIVIDGNDTTYWVEIHRPRIRKNSGGLSGSFRRGISVTGVSNATQIIGGDINNFVTGLYISNSNSVVAIGTAFEGGTDGVELAAGAASDVAGTRLWGLRFEAVTYAVNITATRTEFALPIFMGAFASSGDLTEEVHNPNGVPITYFSGTQLLIDSPDLATPEYDSVVSVRASGNQPAANVMFRGLGSGGGQVFGVDPSGNILLTSDSAGVPEPAVKTGIFNYREDDLRIIAWNPASTSGRIRLMVGDGAGDRIGIIQFEAGYASPEVDNYIRLGHGTANRYKLLTLAEHIDMTEMSEPAAPPANTARWWVKDVAGKTAVMVRFPSGASQQVSIEP